MQPACGPIALTQPMTTSSTADGSTPVAVHQLAQYVCAQSAGCTPASAPLRVPTGVRTAPTM